MNGNLIRSLALMLFVPWCYAPGIASHPFHISTAEMELNAETGRFEVALKLHATDLEQALSSQEKRKINIGKDANAEQLLTSYLDSHFFLMDKQHLKLDEDGPVKIDPKQTRSKIHYVGHELKTNWLWVFFEVEPLADEAESQEKAEILVNSVLLDVTEGQINTVAVRQGGKKFSLRTTVRQAWAELQ